MRRVYQVAMILPTRDRPPATARKLTAFAATLVTWDNLGSYIFAEHTKPPPQRPLARPLAR